MADNVGKTKIKELKLELYLDDEIRAALQEMIDGKKESLELSQVYFRHLQMEDFKHEGYKISQLKVPIGRITKVKIKVITS